MTTLEVGGGGLDDQAAAAVARMHTTLTRVGAALCEAFTKFAEAARKLVGAMNDLIRGFRAWAKVMRRKVMWLDRGRPGPLRIDGRAYQRRLRSRRRR